MPYANSSVATQTRHAYSCAKAFNRLDKTCPRCQELAAGAAPRAGWRSHRAEAEAQRATANARHVCDARCGVVCTFGQW